MTDQQQGTVAAAARTGPAPDADPAAWVLRETDGNVGVLTMQKAPFNLLDKKFMNEIMDAVLWAVESGARSIVLRSALRHFCAGAAMEAFGSAERGEPSDLPFVDLLEAFDSAPVPIIASVHGAAVGGGLELALAADLVVAAESAKLGAVEVGLGLAPLMGAVQRLTQRAGAVRAREIAMFGLRYDAETFQRWNIINRVVADDELAAVTMTMGRQLADGPTVALASIKRLVSVCERDGVGMADQRMAEVVGDVWRSADLRNGIASLVANGPGHARFEGR
jgi:enoyl-CoA hydratase/carnithine racemase